MPVLDAKALKSDPQGLAFLRDVLRPAGEEGTKTPTAAEALRLRRRKMTEAVATANASR